VTKYTYALDEQLKLINGGEFFFKFLHPSLNTDEFIDIDKKNKKNLISFIRKSHYPERLFPPEQFRINEVRVYLKWINYFLNFSQRCVKSIYYWNQQN